MFRNESEEVAKKSKAKAKAKAASRNRFQVSSLKSATPNSTSSPLTASVQDAQSPSELFRYQDLLSSAPLSYSYNLAPTINERATGYFFTNYVVGADGPWDHILDDNMTTSIKALGLAGFSHAAHAPTVMIEAREQYLRAIRLTNAALRSPRDVKKDSTLLSIMILGMFETVTGRNRRSLEAWANHVNGAAALLKIRGPEQMITPGGRRMFAQVTSTLVTTCLQHQLAMPDHILELRNEGAKYQATDDPIWHFFEFMILFTNFKAHVEHGEVNDPPVILARALELDRMFLSLCSNVPPGWEYTTIYTNADPEVIYAGYYHLYHDFIIAQLWNGMRTFRIMLHEIIRGVLTGEFGTLPEYQMERDCAAQFQNTTVLSYQSQDDSLPSTSIPHTGYARNNRNSFSAQFQKSLSISYQLQSDILASIPQHIGYASKPSNQPSSLQRFLWSNFDSKHPYPLSAPISPSSSSHLPLIRMTEGYTLLWPLYTAGIMNIATVPVQRWVAEMLRKIGRSMGTQQAFVLADMLEQKIASNEQNEAPTCLSPDPSDTETEIDLGGHFQDSIPVSSATT
ncbi:hypothetical protein MMC17_003886 [Xylographa soralifera]|nr:hypothetical protein [Xylographa soralifera]